MRVAPGNQARTSYYDRTATVRAGQYVATIAPAGGTDRLTYTVPAGFNAILEKTHLFMSRVTAAGPAAAMLVRWLYTPSGGSQIVFGKVRQILAAVDDWSALDEVPVAFMAVGDVMTLNTADTSTGGSISFEGGYKLTEFAI